MQLILAHEEILKKAVCQLGYLPTDDTTIYVLPNWSDLHGSHITTAITTATGNEITTYVGEIVICKDRNHQSDYYFNYEIVENKYEASTECTLKETDPIGELLPDGQVITVKW